MYAHLIVFLAEEKYVATENERDDFIKLENRIDASDKESSKGVEFVKILHNDLDSITLYRMVIVKHLQEIIKPEIGLILMRLAEFPVDFLYDAVGDHCWNVKLLLDIVLFRIITGGFMVDPCRF